MAESGEYASEEALLKSLGKSSRVPPVLVVLDRQGKQLDSERIAELIRDYQEGGTQELVFAVGPADGWTHAALTAADFKLSFGPITLPHELARVVLAEQLYRAFTILKGHPYHMRTLKRRFQVSSFEFPVERCLNGLCMAAVPGTRCV